MSFNYGILPINPSLFGIPEPPPLRVLEDNNNEDLLDNNLEFLTDNG